MAGKPSWRKENTIDDMVDLAMDRAERNVDVPFHKQMELLSASSAPQASSSNTDVWAEKARVRSTRAAVDRATLDAHLMNQFSDCHQQALDLYNGALEAKRPEEVTDFIDEFAVLRASVVKLTKQANDNDFSQYAADFRTIVSTIDVYRQRIEDDAKQLGFVLDSWEDACDDVAAPSVDVQKALLEGIKVTFPFTEEREGFEAKASHPVMCNSRIVGSTMAYMSAAKNARKWMAANPYKTAAVVDLGAGAFGGERLQMLKTSARNKHLFLHVCIPEVDTADIARLDRFRMDGRFPTYNYIPETLIPRVGVLNYCRHRAHECTCLRKYDHIEPTAIHSSYYFRAADYLNVLGHPSCGNLTAIVHIPEHGTTIPKQRPEYAWFDACTKGTFVSRLRSQWSHFITGDRDVMMAPMQTGETTYTHKDIARELSRGGFHVNRITTWADGMAEPRFAFVEVLKATGVAFCNAAVITPGTPATRVVGGLVAAAAAATGVIALAIAGNRLSHAADPPIGTTSTIAMRIKNTYTDATFGEEIFSVLQVAKDKPHRLESQCIRSAIVDDKAVAHATQALLLGGDSEKTQRGVAAALVRDGKPIHKVKSSMEHAMRCVRFLCCPPEELPPPWYAHCLLAICTLPFASGLATSCQSMALVALKRHCTTSVATAFTRAISTPIFWICALGFLWANLTYVAIVLGGLALVRRLLD